jgi:histidinol-phosphatase (PHP family)
MTAQEACTKALESGLDGISVTEHLDYDFPEPDDDFFDLDFDNYINSMKLLKEQKKNELKISIGIEAGIQPHVIGKTLEKIQAYDFDYVLASVHVVDGFDPYKPKYYFGKTKKDAYGRYLQEILFMVRNFPDFDNVGHFEYVTRYAPYDDRTLRYNDQKDLFDELLKEIINKGRGFELNTGSFRDKPGMETCRYDIEVLKRYRALGGEIISLGSDAHNTGHIGYKFGIFRELLMEARFCHAAYFENRKPVFYRL